MTTFTCPKIIALKYSTILMLNSGIRMKGYSNGLE